MPKRSLRILHLSDLHIGKEKAPDAWRVERVMGDAWNRNLDEIRADGPIDLVCFTGDLAQSGHPDQYKDVARLIDAVLRSVGCPRERFFCVPGNHDIDRTMAPEAWAKLRELQWHAPQELSRWMVGGKAPFGAEDAWRDAVIGRQQAYRSFLDEARLPHLQPGQFDNPHPRLGYRRTLDLGLGQPLHIVGFDSAWLAGDDHDAGKLRLTDDQIGRLMTGPDGKRLPGWSIGLIHHPLTDLADARDAQRLLGEYGLGLLLHGHQHDPLIERWADPQTGLHVFAAGCLYEHARYPNGLLVVDVEIPEAEALRPRQVWARKWSHRRSEWIDDDELYRGTRNGRLRLIVDVPAPPTPTPGKFVGRDDEREALCAALLPAARGEDTTPTVICCAIAGMPGVGKTRLAEVFIETEWREALGLPAGIAQADLCARLAFAPNDRRGAQDIAAALLSAYGRNVPPDRAFGELRVLLGSGPGDRRLLLIENVDGPQQAEAVAALVAHLPGCAVLATARYRDLSDQWLQVSVKPLPRHQAIKLLRNRMAIGRNPHPLNDEEAVALVERLGRLPLALHIAGSHLGRGLSPQALEKALREKQLALGQAGARGDAAHDSNAARTVIASAFALSWDVWCQSADAARQAALVALAHGPAEGVGDALGAAMTDLEPAEYETCTRDADGLSLLDLEFVEHEGATRRRVRLHPLIAEFLRLQPVPDQLAVMKRLEGWIDLMLDEEKFDVMRTAWAALRAEVPALLHWIEHAPQPLPGELLARAVKLSEIADILQSGGELEEALRIQREVVLPALERLGVDHATANAQGKIANILQARGELEGALRIRREEELPVYERLGDVRSRALTQGRIADILLARGELDKALRIRREEELPVYARLGDVRSLLVGRANLAITLVKRGQQEDRPEILTLLQQALADAERLHLPEAKTIRDLIAQIFGDGDDTASYP